MNNDLNIDVKTLNPFRRFIYTIGALPTSYLMSMTYEEQLIWLCNYLAETVIPTVNNNGLAVEELQAKYIELKSYVDNYFEDLDVQEEINNKLDEMALDGTLENIISQYIQLQTTYTYNNVAEMKEATNLFDGSFVRTSGFYSFNDGGGAYYKVREVTNVDVIDETFLFALDDPTLVAEYIVQNDELNIKSLGCKGDNSTDNTTRLQAIINKAQTTGYKITIPLGNYVISDTLYITDGIVIEGLGKKRLWKGTSVFPAIVGYIADKPFINISDQTSSLYNWDTAKNHLVENVHIKNLRLIGSGSGTYSLTGIFASCYLSSFENISINGFFNDISYAGCYETVTSNCQFMQSYQNLVLFDNNRTTIFNNVYCNGGSHTSGSVISNATYTSLYTKNHMYNYACVYSNISYHNFYNLAVEDSCYGIISRDSDITSNITNFESLSDYCVHCSLNLKSDVYTNLDNVHFFNPDSSAYENCKMFYTSYHSKLNLKTVDALPVNNIGDGDITNNSIARIYSYVTGEKIIPLTLSANVEGATIVNKSHYTEQGFLIDYMFKDQTAWSGSTGTQITGIPASTSFTTNDYIFFACPTTTANVVFNIRIRGDGNITSSAGAWIGGGGVGSIVHVLYEYKIT